MSARRRNAVAEAVRRSGFTIYDELDTRPDLFYDIELLEEVLRSELFGVSLGYPLRTRSKVMKQAVCAALGYDSPDTFRRVRPRFSGQDLDVYVQKGNNLQIWNEEVSPTRRYALVRLNASDTVVDVRVVTGESLAELDRTGTLTSKYQAKRRSGRTGSKLVSGTDTANLKAALQPRGEANAHTHGRGLPTQRPTPGRVLSVGALFGQLRGMIGTEISDPGLDQERVRGAGLHRAVCEVLGFADFVEHGQFPDILSEVLEVKLQTSPTIDLGLVAPDSGDPAEQVGRGIRHCDVRYAVFYGQRTAENSVRLLEVVMACGADFFTEFQRFEGKVLNRKLQIPLPRGFFRETE